MELWQGDEKGLGHLKYEEGKTTLTLEERNRFYNNDACFSLIYFEILK